MQQNKTGQLLKIGDHYKLFMFTITYLFIYNLRISGLEANSSSNILTHQINVTSIRGTYNDPSDKPQVLYGVSYPAMEHYFLLTKCFKD